MQVYQKGLFPIYKGIACSGLYRYTLFGQWGHRLNMFIIQGNDIPVENHRCTTRGHRIYNKALSPAAHPTAPEIRVYSPKLNDRLKPGRIELNGGPK